MSEEKKEKLGFTDIIEKVEGVYDGRLDVLDSCIQEAFEKTVKRSLSTGKVGKLTVTLSFNRTDDKRMEIKGEVKTSLPNPVAGATNMYHDIKGNLHQSDPRYQHPDLPKPKPLRAVGSTN